jgi:hypothetical protein
MVQAAPSLDLAGEVAIHFSLALANADRLRVMNAHLDDEGAFFTT